LLISFLAHINFVDKLVGVSYFCASNRNGFTHFGTGTENV